MSARRVPCPCRSPPARARVVRSADARHEPRSSRCIRRWPRGSAERDVSHDGKVCGRGRVVRGRCSGFLRKWAGPPDGWRPARTVCNTLAPLGKTGGARAGPGGRTPRRAWKRRAPGPGKPRRFSRGPVHTTLGSSTRRTRRIRVHAARSTSNGSERRGHPPGGVHPAAPWSSSSRRGRRTTTRRTRSVRARHSAERAHGQPRVPGLPGTSRKPTTQRNQTGTRAAPTSRSSRASARSGRRSGGTIGRERLHGVLCAQHDGFVASESRSPDRGRGTNSMLNEMPNAMLRSASVRSAGTRRQAEPPEARRSGPGSAWPPAWNTDAARKRSMDTITNATNVKRLLAARTSSDWLACSAGNATTAGARVHGSGAERHHRASGADRWR